MIKLVARADQSAAELSTTTGNSRGKRWELEEGQRTGEGVLCACVYVEIRKEHREKSENVVLF